jgi:hypothetical protein
MGEIDLERDGRAERFQWQAWWNGYTLMIMLRRRPALGVLRRLTRS